MNVRSQAFASPALIALLAVFAAGCQSPHASKGENVEKPVQLLNQATVCCEDYSELSYKKLPPRYEVTLVLDEEDPVYQFDSGKSYVEAIVLPESRGETLLQIDSLVSRRNAFAPSHAVFPVVTLLDSEFNTKNINRNNQRIHHQQNKEKKPRVQVPKIQFNNNFAKQHGAGNDKRALATNIQMQISQISQLS